VSSLFLSALPQPLADLGLDKALRDALLKLMAALPSSKREHIEQERALVYLDPASWFQRAEPVPYLSLLQYAAREQRQVKIRYNYPDGHQEDRLINPYGLVAKTSLWYVVANTARGMRIYKVARIAEAELLDSPFERPAEFDLVSHWEQQRGTFEKNLQRYEIQLSIAPYMGDVFQKIYGESADAILNTATPPDAQGWRTVTLTFENIRQAGHEVLMLGADVEVVAPLELRDYVADTAQKIAQRYAPEMVHSA
jgi:predicted DNA-binding transcriptional regulator YafY